MQNASTIIFYRIPFSKLTESYLDEALRLKLKIGYDIDDPIFDKEIYSQNTNLNFLDKGEKKQLIKNAKHYASILRQCDFVTTSTPFMKEILHKYTKGNVYIWRNLMDAQSLNAAKVAMQLAERNTDPNKFVLGYMSGSRAHEADFEIVIDAIETILDKYSQVDFYIVGYAKLAKSLSKKFGKRVIHIEFSEYYAYMASFLKFDLNIIPLVQNQFNECKSAIRYLESSLLEVPSLVTYIGDFKHIIKHKETGIFVYKNTTAEWVSTIEWSIENKENLHTIGKAAKENTLSNYSTISVNDESFNPEILTIEI